MLFWMARRTVRSCTRRRSSGGSGGGGCLVLIVGLIMIGGIIGGANTQPANEFQAPPGVPAGPYGWVEDAHGHFQPAMAPIPVGVPFIPPYAAPAPPAGPTFPGVLVALLTVAFVLGGLAIIGSRMTPKPIWTPPKDGPPDFPAAEQLGGGGPPPDNPAQWSDRR